MNNFKVILSNGEVVFITAHHFIYLENSALFYADEYKKVTEQNPIAIIVNPILVVKVENMISNPTMFKNTTVV